MHAFCCKVNSDEACILWCLKLTRPGNKAILEDVKNPHFKPCTEEKGVFWPPPLLSGFELGGVPPHNHRRRRPATVSKAALFQLFLSVLAACGVAVM